VGLFSLSLSAVLIGTREREKRPDRFYFILGCCCCCCCEFIELLKTHHSKTKAKTRKSVFFFFFFSTSFDSPIGLFCTIHTEILLIIQVRTVHRLRKSAGQINKKKGVFPINFFKSFRWKFFSSSLLFRVSICVLIIEEFLLLSPG
jgi:hypothetical protein